MKRIFHTLIAIILLSSACLTGYGQSRAAVIFNSDRIVPVGDSTAFALVDNVLLYHNGAILSCDSAVRYGPDYFECFDNVIINRDSTYVYGDRADFNGVTNLAKVYAPIIKTTDGDMTMFSYDMEFNTLTKIGRFTQGGTVSQKDNRMEAIEAIYHAEERDVFFVKEVVMRNEEYIIQTDSMGYNFDSEVTTFYKPAKIWNKDGDFLSADKGSYDRLNDTYLFTQNSYILTKEQEVFADSITYMSTAGLAYVFNNVQIHDQAHSSLLLGDYGVYWTQDQQAVMTDNPSVISYDSQKEAPDSTYMRGDTIFMHSVPANIDFTPDVAERLKLPGREQIKNFRHLLQDSTLLILPDSILPDSLSNWGHLYGEDADSTRLTQGIRGGIDTDSLTVLPAPDSLGDKTPHLFGRDDSYPLIVDPPSSLEQEKTPVPFQEQSGRDMPLITPGPETLIPAEEQSKITGTEAVSLQEQEDAPKTKKQLRQEKKLKKREEKMTAYAVEQGLIDTLPKDTLTVAKEIPAIDEFVVEPTEPTDSIQRVARSHRNVRIYREDLQAVCDSLIAFSIDSTAHMYIEPVLWSNESQITAEEVHAYTKDEELYRIDFEGDPLIVQWVIDSLFSQIAGDLMEAYFKNNDIIRLDVLGHAESYYYMQEESDPNHIGGFSTMLGQDITIRFDSMKIDQIVSKIMPKYSLYPMYKIPDTQPQRFNHFQWLEHLRPKTHLEVCDRIVVPSKREENESLPYPAFRITDKIEADKKRLTKEGIWRERNDILNVDSSYFINQTFD